MRGTFSRSIVGDASYTVVLPGSGYPEIVRDSIQQRSIVNSPFGTSLKTSRALGTEGIMDGDFLNRKQDHCCIYAASKLARKLRNQSLDPFEFERSERKEIVPDGRVPI